MKVTSCRFECSAFRAQDEPRARGPLVAFLGCSNVGKSSLINRLLGVPGIAKTSSQPGRTQSVNFYRVNESMFFVDLPGYGYAKVPERVRRNWGPMVEGFLERQRERIALAVLLLDARRGTKELDIVMRDWFEARDLRYVVVASKIDKLSASARGKMGRKLREEWAGSAVSGVVLSSSQTGMGLREVWREVDLALSGGSAGAEKD